MSAAGPSTRRADPELARAAARELDGIAETVDALHAAFASTPPTPHAVARLREVRQALGAVLDEAVGAGEAQGSEDSGSFLTYEEAYQEEARDEVHVPREEGEPVRRGEPVFPRPTAQAQGVLQELHALRMEKLHAAIDFLGEYRRVRQERCRELVDAIVEARRQARTAKRRGAARQR